MWTAWVGLCEALAKLAPPADVDQPDDEPDESFALAGLTTANRKSANSAQTVAAELNADIALR